MPCLNHLLPAALLLPALAAAQAVAPDAVTLFERVRASVAVVEISQGGTPVQGSAVALGGARFVTACSLLDGGDTVQIAAGAQHHAATRQAGDPPRNLCLLSAPGTEAMPALPVAAELPPAGTRVYAVSNALGLGLSITEGVLSAVRSRGAAPLLQFSAPVSPGSDGGALVDAQGRLLGVIEVGLREGQNLNFAVAAAAIGEIEVRQERDARRQALRDQAPRLTREGETPGEALFALAGEWTRLYPEDVEGWTWLAVAAGLRRDAAAMETAWRKVRARDPGSLAAGLGIAEALLRQQRTDAAHDTAQALVAAHRDSADAWALLGTAQLMRADAAAEASFRQALDLDPWQMTTHRGLVALAQARGNHVAAAAAWNTLAHRFPDDPALRWKLVNSLLDAGDPAAAWTTLEDLPAALAAGADALYWRAEVLAALGRPLHAIETLRQALALGPGPADAAAAWSRLGRLLHGQRRFPESIAAHREAVRTASASIEHRLWLVVSLKDGGRLDEALALSQRLVQEAPETAAAWRQLGLAQSAALHTGDSIAALERSLALEPRQPRLWALLMQLYRAAGRPDAVLRAHEQLRGLDLALAERSWRATVEPWLPDTGAAGVGAAR